MPNSESERKTPFGIGRRLTPSIYHREVIFPEGYTHIEYLPESWEITLPYDNNPRVKFSVEKSFQDGRLKVAFKEEHFPGSAMMFSKDWLGFFSDWNRRTGSRLVRTVIVRKPK